jgi:hypothetical protein
MARSLFCPALTLGTLVVCVTAMSSFGAQPAASSPDERPSRERRGPAPRRNNVQVVHDPTGFVPLTEMGDGEYKGLDGGLYGGGKNEPPAGHRKLALQALKRIRPLNAKGEPDADGKVVLISIGMSNTTMEFMAFKRMADADPAKAPHVVIVDTAQGGRSAGAWAKSLSGNTRRANVPLADQPYEGTPGENSPDQQELGADHTVWEEADRRVRGAGCTPQQVQVVWIKVAGSVKLGFPEHLKEYQGHLATIVRLAKARYRNLQIAYLSSRIYAGYATTMLNPEPWSYESAFGVRGVIQQQIKGDPDLNADAARGPVKAPVLLWGPYLWADGTKPRADGLIWQRKDLARDGIHPTRTGTRKVSQQLLRFLTTDPLARPWFKAN